MQGNLRFRKEQANLAVLFRQLPRLFEQRQRFVVFAFLHQSHGFLRLQLFLAWQDFIQQGANRFFRLWPLEAINRLPILEQIDGWNRAQAKLRRHHRLSVTIQFGENELAIVLRGKAFEYRRQLQTVLATLRPEVEQHRFGHGLFEGLLQVCFSNIDDILYGHAAFSFIGLLFTWGLATTLQLNRVKFCPSSGPAAGVLTSLPHGLPASPDSAFWGFRSQKHGAL